MGSWFDFRCPKCGYSANVSGGADVGKDILTQTVHCHDCHTLQDVIVLQDWGTTEAKEKPPRCRRGARHRVTAWNDPGPCPVCATTLERDEESFAIWD